MGVIRMSDLSYVQSNFQGGEVSSAFQGRMDSKDYAISLALCMNYIPNQEGSLTPRGGLRHCGHTAMNAPAKLIPFRFSLYEPYVAEFTSTGEQDGLLQFWGNGIPILSANTYALLTSVAGDPPVFTVQDSYQGSGNGLDSDHWANGDSVYIVFQNVTDIENYGYLLNREWTMTITSFSNGTFRLSDAETGDPLEGSINFTNPTVYFYKPIRFETNYGQVQPIRKLEFTSSTTTKRVGHGSDFADLRARTDHRVAFLHQLINPKSLSSALGIERGLQDEDFQDGPYLDSLGTDIPISVSGTKGEIDIVIHGYHTGRRYLSGDLAYRSFFHYFVSLTDDNIGNALPDVPDANGHWAPLPDPWDSGETYFIGQPAAATFSEDFVPSVYYSKTAGNTNHDPETSPSNWSTTPPTYSAIVTYSSGAHVISGGIQYVSIQAANTGNTPASSPTFWLPVPDIDDAMDEAFNEKTGWPSQYAFSSLDPGGQDFNETSPGRLIRLKWGYQPWSADWTYGNNDKVNYKDNLYKSLSAGNLGNVPDQDAEHWEIMDKTILWTWGQVTAVADRYKATIRIRGDDLPTADTIWEFRLGLYCDANGWPTAGVYHEGRVWLVGPTPNRFDAGVSNGGFNFSPTAPDGTVADNNAISYTLNARENEIINALASTAEGILMATSEGEWLISASNLNDPLTPTSIQAHKITSVSTARQEVEYLPNATAVIQFGGRRLMEYRNYVEQESYQSRLNASDLTLRCQHLTTDGIGHIEYQRIPQPVIWCCPGGLVDTAREGTPCVASPNNILIESRSAVGTMFGIGYAKTPDVTYVAPFSFEHGRTVVENVQQDISSLAVQRGHISTAEYLYIAVAGADDLYHVEMMYPPPDNAAWDDVLDDDGDVAKYGQLSQAMMLDSAIMPQGCKIASDGLSATFYGINFHRSETVQFTCRGKFVGNVTVGEDGDCNVAFNDAFQPEDIALAMWTPPNATILPTELSNATSLVNQRFYLDASEGDTGLETSSSPQFLGFFGIKYRRRGQQLRPAFQGNTGPSFAKSRRNALMGVYVDKAQEISIGDTFDNLRPLTLTVSNQSVRALTPSDFVTGIFRDSVEDDHTYDGNLCWEQTVPVPGSVLAVGGFLDYEEKA